MIAPRRLAIAAGVLAATVAPPAAAWWESSLPRHMLGQIPLLVAAGAFVVGPASEDAATTRRGEAAAAVLAAAFCLAFWMMPRWLDAAVADRSVDAVKMATLVLLAGLPLGWGWRRLGAVARGFVLAQAVSMFAVLGLLYLTFPDRLCNSYLLDEQYLLGVIMLGLAGVLGVAAAARALSGPAARDRNEGLDGAMGAIAAGEG